MVSVDIKKRDTVIAPYIATTTGSYDGNDGKWSTFLIAVGTPTQSFRVLPATLDSLITVPIPEGCAGQLANWTACGDSRGANAFNNAASRGFVYSGNGASSTFKQLNIYSIYPHQNEYVETGIIGTDNVTLPSSNGKSSISLPNSIVAGDTSFDFWTGTIGLGGGSSNFAANQLVAPSFLSHLKNQSIIPSLSYAYTAGQYYNNIPGSLILGGYDSSRMTGSNVMTTINTSGNTNELDLQISTIYASHPTDGNSQENVMSTSITVSLDTSIAQMWLPASVCDSISNAFGLQYDTGSGFYFVNSTQHDALKSNNASLTFVIGGQASGSTTNIVLDYAALDTQYGLSGFSNLQNYFPMRRAANSTQYTLGRVFMQEAYLVVDWERGNYTIGPVLKPSSSANVIAITTPTAAATTSASSGGSGGGNNDNNTNGGSSGISGGAIAGIVIGVLAILAIAAGIFFFLRRRRNAKNNNTANRQSVFSLFSNRKSVEPGPPAYNAADHEHYNESKPTDAEAMTETKAPQPDVSELQGSQPRHELTSENIAKHQELSGNNELMSTPVAELHGDVASSELESNAHTARDSVTSAGASSNVRSSAVSPNTTAGGTRTVDTVFEME